MVRNEKGQFLETTGTGRYKRKIVRGKNKQLSRVIWENHYGKIPFGCIIHHINKDKKDNCLINLICLSSAEHNKIHAHPAWNKGIKAPQISLAKQGHAVSTKQIQKQKDAWKSKYIDSMLVIHSLHERGFLMKEIAKRLELTLDQVRYRHSKFMRDYYEL